MIEEKEYTISIVTITYNRSKKLEEVANSLINQNDINFTWWVVNDGSSDDTEIHIKKIINIYSELNIKTLTLPNGGKHRAINKILPEIETDLVIFLDDDDRMPTDAINTIKKDAMVYLNNSSDIGSLIYERGINDMVPMNKLPNEIDYGRRYWYLLNNNISGDYSDVFVTKYINKYKLPEFSGERFISEGPLYLMFSENYKSVFIKKILTIGDYQDTGLTKRIRKLQRENIKGALYETYLYLDQDNVPIIYKIKKKILLGKLLSYYKINNKKGKIVNSKKNGLLTIISYCIFRISIILEGCFGNGKN